MKEGIVDVLDTWLQARLKNMHTMLPGQIDKYYGHDERKCKVKIMVKPLGPDGKGVEIKPIDNVPLLFPGGKNFSMLYPVKKGDGVAVFFSEEGLGNFLSGKGQVQDSDSTNRFQLADAIAIPGLWDFKSAPSVSNDNDNDLFLYCKGKVNINSDDSIELKGNTKNFVTHSELNTALQTFIIALNTHTHTGNMGSPTSTPTSPMTIDISSAKTDNIKTGG